MADNRMRHLRLSRRGVRTLLAGIIAALVMAGIGISPALANGATTPAATSHYTSSSDIVGTWNVTVNPTGQSTQYGTITFNSDGSLTVVGQNNSFTGSGLWQGGSSSWFTFTVLHPIPGSSNELHGLLWGQESGTQFNTNGTAQLYGTSYNVLTPTSGVTMTGAKVS